MSVSLLPGFCRSVVLVLIVSISLLPTFPVGAQPFGVGGDSSSSDSSRTPFRVKLRGFLNAKPEEGSKEVKLGISAFQETYQFELVKAEAMDDPQVSQAIILQQVGKYPVDFNLIGPRELLSKIGQSEPGTPLLIIGFFQQRNRTLQLQSVDVIGMKDQ
jgi:hypothetical protein